MCIRDRLTVARLTIAAAITLVLASCNDGASITGSENKADTTLVQAQVRDDDSRPNIVVVFTDDHGYADLGVQGVLGDVVTPHIDQLAADGARMTAGYVTAPQCTPSRAALITGQYQQRFGLDDNRFTPMPLTETTLAERLQDAGYATGMVGKWHLDIDQNSQDFDNSTVTLAERAPYFPDQRGFEDLYAGFWKRWWTNFDLEGNTLSAASRPNTDYRLDVATDAGLTFIDRHKQEPFFLYLNYYAPHVPLEAPDNYLSRFSNIPELRRRFGLAMISAIDDGVGKLREKLDSHQLSDNTLIFFISDNGAPLGIHKLDLPIEDTSGDWDGSLNDPFIGEKGMLSDGGIRVPYIVSWPGTRPAGVVVDTPVSTLDVASTSLTAAGAEVPQVLDGSNLLPTLTEQSTELAERPLYWRFWSQSAIRKGDWKYLKAGSDHEFLFNMNVAGETQNVLNEYPDIAEELLAELTQWSAELHRPGIPDESLIGPELEWYQHYF